MARLNLEARDARLVMHGGTRTTLVISVTDETGAPITDVDGEDISIVPVPVAGSRPGTLVVDVTSPVPGLYAAELALAGWQPGRHVLAVTVSRRFDRGRCLATLELT